MDKVILRQLIGYLFDFLEQANSGHPLVLLIIKSLRKTLLASLGELAESMPPKLVAAMKRP